MRTTLTPRLHRTQLPYMWIFLALMAILAVVLIVAALPTITEMLTPAVIVPATIRTDDYGTRHPGAIPTNIETNYSGEVPYNVESSEDYGIRHPGYK